MVISHNLQALNTNRIANENITLQGKSTEKVSSGYKINHVGDNPVGLAMSETMRRQIRGLNQGIENTKAAINFCQTADGALNEVTEMLQRINELAVKAENGTNLDLDRHYIQAEVEQLLTEIDRVADTTTFNELPIFRKTVKEFVPMPSGPSISEGDIPYDDFALSGFVLGKEPFGKYNFDAYDMNLQVEVKNPDSPAYGKTYDMLLWYEHSFRLFDKNGDSITENPINLHSNVTRIDKDPDEEGLYLITDEYELHSGKDDGSNDYDYCQRTFIYKQDDDVKLKIIQKVTIIPQDQNQEKKYNISYSFENLGNTDVVLDFMSYSDTLYGKDYCGNEFYFVKDENGTGTMLGESDSESCMFIDDGDWSKIFDNGTNNIIKTIPDSLSLIDPNNALAFSEKVSFEQDSMPNAVSVGYPYNYQSNKWNYSDHDVSSHNNDWGFSLFWNREVDAGSSSQLSFNYGIVAYEQDENIHGDINKSPVIIGEPEPEPHYLQKSLWIQTGSEKGSGLWLEIDEMNTEVLGIDKIDLTTIEGAADANTRIKEALHKLALSRSKIGAQQNRLEHTVTNEENIVEKVTSSESLIRDTDLSSEMVRYSNLSVLLQMGQDMIAQADQRVEKILTILQ